MIQITKKNDCTGCHACIAICPAKCIAMERDSEGFIYPRVDGVKCINCGLCEQVCPVIAPLVSTPYPQQQAYVAINQDEAIRLASSSGGVFTLLAKWIIERGGIVFGAAFNESFEVVHIGVESVSDLDALRGSKYVQSRIGDCYLQAKEQLEAGRLVLFTGTPCQIAGLKAFLQKDHDNLYCQDIICHGVPSPMVWADYVDFRQKNLSAPVRRIAFRRKDDGWKRYSVAFATHRATEYRKTLDQDFFMRGFLANLYLRPSCYDCHFKTLNRDCDITLADFWGIQKVLPEMDDDKGTSLVWINSAKGKNLWEAISKELKTQEVSLQEAVSYNSAAVKSCLLPEKRDAFFNAYKTEDFEGLINRLTKVSMLKRCYRGVRHRMKRILIKMGMLD